MPQTDIRSELYPTVGEWCLRGIGVGLAIVVPLVLASDDPATSSRDRTGRYFSSPPIAMAARRIRSRRPPPTESSESTQNEPRRSENAGRPVEATSYFHRRPIPSASARMRSYSRPTRRSPVGPLRPVPRWPSGASAGDPPRRAPTPPRSSGRLPGPGRRWSRQRRCPTGRRWRRGW